MKAIELANSEIQKNGGTPQIYMIKAQILDSLGQNEAAFQNYQQALTMDQKNVYSLYKFGKFLQKTNKIAESDEVFKQLLGIDKEFRDASFELINNQVIQGDLEGAGQKLNQFIQKYPDYSDAFNLSAQINYKKGKKKEALEDVEKGLKVDPNNGDLKRAKELLTNA